MSLSSVLIKIRKWGEEKDIITPGDRTQLLKQHDKMIEEVAELRAEIEAGERYKSMMELGDVIVTAEIEAANMETTLEECAKLAYQKIKSRKGKTINGQFVKESDL